MKEKESRIKGALYGFAYGDAWGKETEFLSHEQALIDYPDFPDNAVITDDTQMSIYVLLAMKDLMSKQEIFNEDMDSNLVRTTVLNRFIEWLYDPDNTRDPGQTCLKAVHEYVRIKCQMGQISLTGLEATQWASKGCGANMRTGWLGLLPIDENTAIKLAVLQAETTHGHPLALASSAITTSLVWNFYQGGLTLTGASLMEWTMEKMCSLIKEMSQDNTNPFHIVLGMGLKQLIKSFHEATLVWDEFAQSDGDSDICSFFGEGWVAEESLISSLSWFALYSELMQNKKSKNVAIKGIRRLVNASGDSESMGAMGCMFLGATYGFSIFPKKWRKQLETRYDKELSELSSWIVDITIDEKAAAIPHQFETMLLENEKSSNNSNAIMTAPKTKKRDLVKKTMASH